MLGGKYRILRWIADGGMGTVFEGENTWTKRRVAVKILDPEVGKSSDRVQRFLREARSSTRVEHPNIVDVLDMGEDDPTKALFLVQELLKGKDLRNHLRDTPNRRLRPSEAITLLLPIMEALEASHALGVIHRDVKPANIFLAQMPGRPSTLVPKLIDFGLSKFVRGAKGEGPSTGYGVPIGTPHYMSPEAARGDADIDGRTDLWSIGVVLYECLTGVLPFEAANVSALLMKIATERPKPVDERADVPAEIAAIVHRALEPDRSRRWASMTDLLHAVRETILYGELPNVTVGPSPGSISGTIRAVRPVDRGDDEPSFPGTTGSEAHDDELRRAIARGTAAVVVRAPAVIERLTWKPSLPPPPPSSRMNIAVRALKENMRLGIVPSRRTESGRDSIRDLSKAMGKEWKIAVARSYADLVDALTDGELDIAWLPPVAYVRAIRTGAARLMLTLERDGRRSYSAAIVAREGGPTSVQDMVGRRAIWTDPWSAAGYLVPRCMLRSAGIEPDATFAGQAFAGSYDEVVRALADGTADVGATYCRVAESGEIVGGPWRDERRVRPIAVSAEPIPGDTICTTTALSDEDARRAIARFIEAAATQSAQSVFREIFGTDRFVAANASRYEGLEAALVEDVASKR